MDARMNQDHPSAPSQARGLVQLEQGFRLAETDHLALAHRIKRDSSISTVPGIPR